MAKSGEVQALGQGGAAQGWALPTPLKAPSVPAPEGKAWDKQGAINPWSPQGWRVAPCAQAEIPREAPPSLLPLARNLSRAPN